MSRYPVTTMNRNIVVCFALALLAGCHADDETPTTTEVPLEPIGDICYDFLGCFNMSSPWRSLLRPLPSPDRPDQVATKLYFYTRNQPERFNVKLQPEVSMEGSDFDNSRQTFFIVHGFSSNGNSSWLMDMKDAILEKVDANVFVVDWGGGAEKSNYFQVASNTRIVGAELTRFGQYLRDDLKADLSQFHLIGHSLGSHIVSYFAKGVPGIHQITALDPAQPAFEGLHSSVRLDISDADIVVAVHTDAKPIVPYFGFGIMRPAAHIDFYMNGGASQPGCIDLMPPANFSFMDLARIPVEVISGFVVCPHSRAYQYFTDAIRNENCRMWGHKIDPLSLKLNQLTAGIVGQGKLIGSELMKETGRKLGIDSLVNAGKSGAGMLSGIPGLGSALGSGRGIVDDLSSGASGIVSGTSVGSAVVGTGKVLVGGAPTDPCTPGRCIPLGLDTIEYPARGSFVVYTNSKSPFCIPEPESELAMEGVKGSSLSAEDQAPRTVEEKVNDFKSKIPFFG